MKDLHLWIVDGFMLVMIVWLRFTHLHLTDMEMLVQFWPMYAMVIFTSYLVHELDRNF